MTLYDFFDSIRIINLPNRVDRRKEVSEELSRLGITIGHNGASFFDAIRPTEPGGFPTVGARGCFLSHLELLKESRASKVKHLLIFEDDVDFFKTAVIDIEEILENIKKIDWDIIYLGHLLKDLPRNGAILQKYGGEIRTSHAYAVNHRCFNDLIEFLELILSRQPGDPLGGPMHIDGAISTFRAQKPNIKTFVATEPICYQRPSKTDIHVKRFNENNYVVKFVLTIFRLIKRKLIKLKSLLNL